MTRLKLNKSGNLSEHDEQCVIFDWVRLMACRDQRYKLIYAIPNGGSRHPAEAVRMKRAGVKAGVADICVDVPAHGFHGLKIELKAGKNTASRLQQDYLNLIAEYGYKTAVCWGQTKQYGR